MGAKTSRQLKENMSLVTSKAELSSVFFKFKELEMSAAIYLGALLQRDRNKAETLRETKHFLY